MSEHTSGPWRWMSADTLVGDHGHRPVVLTWGPEQLTTRGDSGRLVPLTPEHPNARLIAAAPDLLAALRRVLDDEAEVYSEEWFAARKNGLAVLAKAESK